MSETIKDVDSSPARGKTLERCSVSSATFFLVEKQGLQRPLQNAHRAVIFGASGSQAPDSSLFSGSGCSKSLLSSVMSAGWRGPRPGERPGGLGLHSLTTWAHLPRLRRPVPSSTSKGDGARFQSLRLVQLSLTGCRPSSAGFPVPTNCAPAWGPALPFPLSTTHTLHFAQSRPPSIQPPTTYTAPPPLFTLLPSASTPHAPSALILAHVPCSTWKSFPLPCRSWLSKSDSSL